MLSKIPSSERLGDLRLVNTAADLAIAVQASTAEPTYYKEVEETDYSKLMIGDQLGDKGNCQRRLYSGCFILPVVAQDLRRVLPKAYVYSTGWVGLPPLARKYFAHRFNIDVQDIHYRSNWWLDAEFQLSSQTHHKIVTRQLSYPEEFELGFESAHSNLSGLGTPPKFAKEPSIQYQTAIKFPVSHSFLEDEQRLEIPIKTMRGFGQLVKPTH
jgi:hypothetical protein